VTKLIVIGETTQEYIERKSREFMERVKNLTVLLGANAVQNNIELDGSLVIKYAVREGSHLNCYLKTGEVLEQHSTSDFWSNKNFNRRNPFKAHSILALFGSNESTMHLFQKNSKGVDAWQTYFEINSPQDIDNLAYDVETEIVE